MGDEAEVGGLGVGGFGVGGSGGLGVGWETKVFASIITSTENYITFDKFSYFLFLNMMLNKRHTIDSIKPTATRNVV